MLPASEITATLAGPTCALRAGRQRLWRLPSGRSAHSRCLSSCISTTRCHRQSSHALSATCAAEQVSKAEALSRSSKAAAPTAGACPRACPPRTATADPPCPQRHLLSDARQQGRGSAPVESSCSAHCKCLSSCMSTTRCRRQSSHALSATCSVEPVSKAEGLSQLVRLQCPQQALVLVHVPKTLPSPAQPRPQCNLLSNTICQCWSAHIPLPAPVRGCHELPLLVQPR